MKLLSLFWHRAPLVYAYMLQQFEYSPRKFAGWVLKFPDLFSVQKRGRLDVTKRAKFMVLIGYSTWLFVLIIAVFIAAYFHNPFFLLIALTAPLFSALALMVASFLLQNIIVNPRQKREIAIAKTTLQSIPATRIAVLGSYGKTTMKEMLMTVLSEARNVASTPGNKNILVSHARWVNQLNGDEEVLVFEYGEAAPGDIAQLAAFSMPDIAVVTGLAPAHLDAYSSVEAIADDLSTINAVVSPENTFVHSNSTLLKSKIDGIYYDSGGLDNCRVGRVVVDFRGTSFTLAKNGKKLRFHTGLLGTHHLGPLVAVVTIASKLGLTDEQIINGVAAIVPHEHRMQPRSLGGAWIIDDTYNGNIEGMRAGLLLLKSLPATRKIYVTPGLVDQGSETERVHIELGKLIADSQPDRVVLMQNSATQHIQNGLRKHGYKGELVIESDPLDYYTNLEHYVAGGDVMLMQNDWPDSYA